MHEPRTSAVVRLARTMPRADAPGIGLHSFHYARLSRRRSLIITKHLETPPISPIDDVIIEEIRYNDSSVKKEKISVFDILAIGVTKIYGETRLLLGALRAIRRNRIKPEIIHVHSANYLMSGAILKLIYGVPLCLNFGGTELLRAKRIPYYRWMFRRLTVGFYVAKDMEQTLFSMMEPERCVHTGNGIDHALFYADPKVERCDDIICVGNLRWQKDYETLITAFKEIAAKHPSYRIRIFGEGVLRADLEAQIERLGLQNRVILEGMQSQETISTALRQARIFAITSKSEGFPKALIEGMACGLPVVATNAGECQNVLGSIIDTVAIENAEAIAGTLSRLIEDPGYRADVAQKCEARSHDFSWQKVSDIVEATYDKIKA